MTRDRRPFAILCLCALLALGFWFARPDSSAQAQAGCVDVIGNGGFETNDVWQLGMNPVPPAYQTAVVHSGSRAMRLGLVGGPNALSFSSIKQTITIPAAAAQARLSFWFYALYTGAPGTDYMEVDLLANDGFTILDKLWFSAYDTHTWSQVTLDVTRWRGTTLQVYFNVYNDGLGGRAGMYLDDVSLLSCPDATATATATGAYTATPTVTGTSLPTATPTVTPLYIPVTPTPSATPIYVLVTPTASATPVYVLVTPTATGTPLATDTPTATPYYVLVTPTATATPWYVLATPSGPPGVLPPPPQCVDLIQNGGFESGLLGWTPGRDPVPVQMVAGPLHSGAWSLMLGQNASNITSYSSARQLVTIPTGYSQVILQFWTWTWSDSPGSADRQEADFLAPDLRVLQKFWRVLANDQTWVIHQIPVTQYAGQTVQLYFNAYNDGTGGHAGMFLDDVNLLACNPWLVQPYVPVQSGPAFVPVTALPPAALPGPIAVTPTSSPTVGVAVVQPSATPSPSVVAGTTVIALTTEPAQVGTLPTPAPTPVPDFGTAVSNFIRDVWPRPWWLPFVVIALLGVVVYLLRWLLPALFGPPLPPP